MCVRSQYIPIRQLLGGFISQNYEGLLVLLRGYFDESYNDKLFTLSCVTSDPFGWADIERGWKLCIDAKNRSLKAAGRKQISRYHAADCSSRVGEFEGWTVDEQVAFTKELHAAMTRGRAWLNTIAYSLRINDFVEHFPKFAEDPIGPCYGEMLKFVMLEMAVQVEDAKKASGSTRPLSFVLFHERCNYDGTLLHAFNRMLADTTFRGKEMFTTLAPMGWEKCLPLQVADMVAYETFKDAQGKIVGRDRRKSLKALLATNQFGGRSKTMAVENIREWRELTDEAGKQANGSPISAESG